MKTLLKFKFIVAIIVLLSISSCTKDFICECTSTSSSDWGEDYSNIKRSLAKQRCSEYETQGRNYTGDNNASCKIK